MPKNQQPSKRKMFIKATRSQRIIAAWILIIALSICIFWVLAGRGTININWFLAPCGFKMHTGLPCPTCGVTTAMLAFFRGDVFSAFYIQPAGALLGTLLVLAVFLSFSIAVFGVYYSFLKKIKLRYIIIAVIVILLGGWAVTLARALA